MKFLRYILSWPGGQILRKQELDAFLATAFSPDLTNAHYLQDLQVNINSSLFFAMYF